MKCISCGSATKTLETREEHDGLITRRRKKCLSCSTRFNTFEINESMIGALKQYLPEHAALAKKTWNIAQRNTEVVQRVLAGEKRYLLAQEFDLSASTVSRITRDASIPAYSRHQNQQTH